jgi:hypothetical protein
LDGGPFQQFTTAADQYLSPVLTVTPVSDRLSIQIQRITGSWALNGLEITERTDQPAIHSLGTVGPMNLNTTRQITRGETVEGAALNPGVYWVTPLGVQVVDQVGASLNQVMIPSAGTQANELELQIIGRLPGMGQVTLVSADGLSVYQLSVDLVLPAVRRFDFNRLATSNTASGYTPVLPGDGYTAELGYGWRAAVAGVDRGDVIVTPSALFQDNHQGTAAQTFSVLVQPDTPYAVRLHLGDTLARDVEISLDGQTWHRYTTGAGQYLAPSLTVTSKADQNLLDLQIRAVSGSWSISGLEVCEISAPTEEFTLTSLDSLPVGTVQSLTMADAAEDPAIVGGTYWIGTTVGQLTQSGRSVTQVVVDATGKVPVELLNYVPGSGQVWLESLDGFRRYEMAVQFVIPSLRQYDLDHGSGAVVTAAGYRSVWPTDLYTVQRGYGWNGSVSSRSDEGLAALPEELFHDRHRSTAPRTFSVVARVGTEYDVRVHLGDSTAAVVELSVDGGTTFHRYEMAAGEFLSPVLRTTAASEVLEIMVRRVSGYWAINGIEILEVSQTSIEQLTAGPLETLRRETLEFVDLVSGTYWVSASTGTVLGDGQPMNRVQIPEAGQGRGDLSLVLQRSQPGVVELVLVSLDGRQRYELDVTFVVGDWLRFDFEHGTAAVSTSGYLSVPPTARYTPESAFGWDAAVSSVDRGQSSASPATLFQDKHTSSLARTFSVTVDPAGTYQVRLHLGDTVARSVEVSVDGGQSFELFSTAAGEYRSPVLTVTPETNLLDLQFRGAPGSWSISGLELVKVTDGMQTDRLVGPNELMILQHHALEFEHLESGTYWVSSTLGSVYSGGEEVNQLVVGADGRLPLSLFSPTAETAQILLISADGQQRYQLDVQFVLPERLRFDFDRLSSSATTPDYVAVLPGDLYSLERGYGWNLAVSGLDRGTAAVAPEALFQDKHTSTAPRMFQIQVQPDQDYDIRFHLGDTLARSVEICLAGDLDIHHFMTEAGEYISPVITATPDAEGLLVINVRSVRGWWTINGIEVTPSAAGIEDLTAPQTLNIGDLSPFEFSGVAPGVYWISSSVGQVLGAAGGAINQVTVEASGMLRFSLQSYFVGSGRVMVDSLQGMPRYRMEVDFVTPVRQRFDFNHPASPFTAAGYLPVLPGDLHTPARGYGWQRAVSSVDRGAATVSPEALFQDKHESYFSRSFLVAVEAGRDYDVRLHLGDTVARDLEVSVDGGETFQRFTTGAYPYNSPVLRATAVSDSLEIVLRRVSGSWALHGLEVIPVDALAQDDLSVSGDEPDLDALALGELHALSFESVPAGIYWVWSTVGQVVDDSGRPLSQLTVGTTDPVHVWLQSYAPGDGQLLLESLEAPQRYGLDVRFVLAQLWRGFDLNRTTASDTATGYQAVLPSDVFRWEQGYGWDANVSGLQRSSTGLQPAGLLSDKHQGVGERTFSVVVQPGRQYEVRVHLGDTLPRELELSVDGGQTYQRYNTAAGEYQSPLLRVTADGPVLPLQVRSAVAWAINGIEIRDVTEAPTSSVVTGPTSLEIGQNQVMELAGVAAGTYWVSTTAGRVVSPSTMLGINQVQVTAGQPVSFAVIGYLPGEHSVVLESLMGSARYETTPITFVAPVLRRYDFDHTTSSSITAADFDSVLGNQLFTIERGYGWDASTRSANRTRVDFQPVEVFQDNHHHSSPRMFRILVNPDQAYEVRFYLGDTSARSTSLSFDGQEWFTFNTAANEYLSPMLEVTPSDPVLQLHVRSASTGFFGSPWSLSGLEIAEAGQLPANPLRPWWDGPAVSSVTWSGSESLETSHRPASTLLTAAQLAPLVSRALDRWQAAGVESAELARLRSLEFVIEDLDARGVLGLSGTGWIRIDDDALGVGWFVDPTPELDEEYDWAPRTSEGVALVDSAAAGRFDLLTVLMHELGNALGYPDIVLGSQLEASVMVERLPIGIRRLPAGQGGRFDRSEPVEAESGEGEVWPLLPAVTESTYAWTGTSSGMPHPLALLLDQFSRTRDSWIRGQALESAISDDDWDPLVAPSSEDQLDERLDLIDAILADWHADGSDE